ncbi:hypothetical protein G4B88_016527 [Cannabis sativa]|uniref:Uncharacterized protein n=1 Tax=Cannabis sativa TaxID=3483 RepID=A0A7J6H7F9_CANSA|nr:hypothetical protein G4B88_016527 [Cannabis sativa]
MTPFSSSLHRHVKVDGALSWQWQKEVGIKCRTFFLLSVAPSDSIMSRSSCFIPLGSFQLKWYSNNARVNSTFTRPSDIPAHILLPAPNGRYSKWLPFESIELLNHLSGIKLSGSVQYLGSLAIAHTLTMARVFAAIAHSIVVVDVSIPAL